MRKIFISLMLLLNSLCLWAGKSSGIKFFAIYYGHDLEAKAFQQFDLVVLESSNPGIIRELKAEHKIVLGYLSLGEVNKTRDYFAYVKDKECLLVQNPNWPEAFMVDIRKPAWRSYVLETLVPSLLDQGFDGVFIDTLDSSIHLERINPLKYKGMRIAAVELIRQMKKSFPDMKIMLNRAFEIVPDVATDLDCILGESICSGYDFNDKKYLKVSERAYDDAVKILKGFHKNNPKLKIMTLDYCDENDEFRRKEIYGKQQANGFIPYVTTIELDRVSPPGR